MSGTCIIESSPSTRDHECSGFTLIELSIVLVIIGLIVGGILVGQNLIQSAAIRAQVTQLQKIYTAVNTFRDKYNALPGDIQNPQNFGLSSNFYNTGATGYTGDGNGIINDWNGTNPPFHIYREPILFFGHLAMAGLIPPTYVTGTDAGGTACLSIPDTIMTPAAGYYSLSLNPQMGMFAATVNGNLSLFLGVPDCAQGDVQSLGIAGVMTPAQAYGIDIKIDDGIPSTGNVIANEPPTNWEQSLGVPDTLQADPTADKCVATSAATAYNLSNGTLQCRLLARVQGAR